MSEEKQTSNKASVDDLSNDDVATLHNILNSGISVSARLARHVANLQDWVKKLAVERKLSK